MADLRCYTIHCYFKIVGSQFFNGEDGFVAITLDEATNKLELEDDIKRGMIFAKDYAEAFEVDLENVIRISRDEYKEKVDEDEED